MPLRLALVASLATAVVAVGPATASAGTYDYLVAPLTKCEGQQQTNTTLSTGEQEGAMACMHNYARARARRAGIRANTLLQTSSDRKTGDMLRCSQFSHTACGRETFFHVKAVGYTSCRSWGLGENIAWGSGSYGSLRAVMTRWVNSTPHRANILNPKFIHLGVGLRKGTFQGRPNAQVWTTHFGYRSC